MKFKNNSIYKGNLFIAEESDLLLFDRTILIHEFKFFWKKFKVFIFPDYINNDMIRFFLVDNNTWTIQYHHDGNSYVVKPWVNGKLKHKSKMSITKDNSIKYTMNQLSELLKDNHHYIKYHEEHKINNLDLFKSLFNSKHKIQIT